MKLVIFVAFVGIAVLVFGAPANEYAKILSYADENDGSGNYSYSFVSEDGIQRQEQGRLYYPDTENETYVVNGQFKYTGPDGVEYTITYQGDPSGFHPEGAHLPEELPK